MSEDYFKTLGLQWGATDEEVNKAFKKHARTWHPDKNDSIRAQIKYEELTKAKDVLTNPLKRRKWEHEFLRRHGARPETTLTGHGLEVALRPDETVSCVDDDSSFDDSFSWSSWAKTEDFEKKPEQSTSSGRAAKFEAKPSYDSFLGSLSTPRDSSGATSSQSGIGAFGAQRGAGMSYADPKTSSYIPSAASDLSRSKSSNSHSNKAKLKEMDTLSSALSNLTVKPKSSGSQFPKAESNSSSSSTAGLASAFKSSGAQVSDTKVKSNGTLPAASPRVSSRPTSGHVQSKTKPSNSSVEPSFKSQESWSKFVENIFSRSTDPKISSTGEAPTNFFTPCKAATVETSCRAKSSSSNILVPSRPAFMNTDDEELGLDRRQKKSTQVSKKGPAAHHEVLKLVEMGFPLEACKKAVHVTEHTGPETAVQWLLEHAEDADFGSPFEEPVMKPSPPGNASDDEDVTMLMALGFTRAMVMHALKATDSDTDSDQEQTLECDFIDDKEPKDVGRATNDARRKPKDVRRGQMAVERVRIARPQIEARNTNDKPWQGEGLVREPDLDAKFLQELERKRDKDFYRQMQDIRRKLPIYKEARNICQTIEDNQVTVIKGETGCGKTTQVPQFILDDFISRGQGSLCRIVCTQPKRISAITVGRRVAHERNERCGGVTHSVGYQIRLESERPRPKASILFCTTGIVLKWLENDRDLSSFSHLILDEVHERDLRTDFLLIIMKEVLRRRRNLKLVLMSATLNAQQFADYYRTRAGGCCPMLNIPGRTFPVEEFFLEDVVELTTYRPKKSYQGRGINHDRTRFEKWLSNLDTFQYSNQTKDVVKSVYNDRYIDMDLVATLVRHISTNKPAGAILVFMPGMEEINALSDKLSQQELFRSEKAFRILQLHGSLMSTEEQQRVFDPAPDGVRKIVISTNIAETSITMDDVVYVIDCGKLKLKNFDARKNISTLQAEWNSKANSQQRKGRAGRVKPGLCYHLYTRHQHERLVDQHKPEMLRLRLEEICLQIKLLNISQGRITEFFQQAMDTVPQKSVERSVELLKKLNALDANEELTPLGYHLARLPVDPHIGKMILLGALLGCLDPILTIAASLDYKSPFFAPRKKQEEANEKMRKIADNTCSDHLMFVNAFNGWQEARRRGDEREYCWDNFLSKETLQTINKNKQHLADYVYDLGFISEKSPSDEAANINSENKMLLRAVLCAGLYPNVGMIVTNQLVLGVVAHYFKIETAQGEVNLHPKSVNNGQHLDYKFLVYYQKMYTSKVFIHDCTAISHVPLLLFALDFEVKEKANGKCSMVIDSFINIGASRETARQFKALHQEFFEVLDEKFENPQPTDWSPNCREGRVMLAILRQISGRQEK
ncbi:ATP-dependent DNA/RNA helicase DHX36-like isoform X2 [Lineus longissimus]|uniref:ATP-dependent DNA/RNA helicase DHX36-like isoform X2 n=1 Tax=Lineus longissimus TaxID=88925 RepID=UPI00315C71F9